MCFSFSVKPKTMKATSTSMPVRVYRNSRGCTRSLMSTLCKNKNSNFSALRLDRDLKFCKDQKIIVLRTLIPPTPFHTSWTPPQKNKKKKFKKITLCINKNSKFSAMGLHIDLGFYCGPLHIGGPVADYEPYVLV